jgi:hypothetical protein
MSGGYGAGPNEYVERIAGIPALFRRAPSATGGAQGSYTPSGATSGA